MNTDGGPECPPVDDPDNRCYGHLGTRLKSDMPVTTLQRYNSQKVMPSGVALIDVTRRRPLTCNPTQNRLGTGQYATTRNKCLAGRNREGPPGEVTLSTAFFPAVSGVARSGIVLVPRAFHLRMTGTCQPNHHWSFEGCSMQPLNGPHSTIGSSFRKGSHGVGTHTCCTPHTDKMPRKLRR